MREAPERRNTMARSAEEQLVTTPKHPRTKVSGPYGHPFHPILVTIPIGAWVASFVFDLVSRSVSAKDAAPWAQGAYWLIAIGVIGAVVAALFGLMDLLGIPRGTKAFRTGLTHLTLNLAIVGAFVASFLLRRSGDAYEKPTSVALIVLSAVALGALVLSGWLGGRLTYRFGVRVAEETDQMMGYRGAGRRMGRAA